MTIKRLADEIADNSTATSFVEPCHVCGWNIDTTEYYEVTAGQYGWGSRGSCYYHIKCYPPNKYTIESSYKIIEDKSARAYHIRSTRKRRR